MGKKNIQIGIVIDGIDVGPQIVSHLSNPQAIDRKILSDTLLQLLPGRSGNYYESLANAIITRVRAADALDKASELGIKKYQIYSPINYPGCIANGKETSEPYMVDDGISYLASHYDIPMTTDSELHIVPPCGPGCLCAVHSII